jgi:hypothetical protein
MASMNRTSGDGIDARGENRVEQARGETDAAYHDGKII